MNITLQEGDIAPLFELADQNGKHHTLKSYQGKWVILFFYPKDDTPGCTKEACAFRDNYSEFQKENITVFGISIDPVSKHEKFVAKYNLPFTLLSDENKEVVESYGVFGEKKFMGKTYMGTNRVSFLINPEGKIAKIYPKVKPVEHAEEVLKDYKNLALENV